MSASRITILDHTGKPFSRNGNSHASRADIADLFTATNGRKRRREIDATFDAARTTTEFSNYWAHADALDADSAHSPAVRAKLVQRSRYETANNGYSDGMQQTHANYVVGTGPTLRMQTGSTAFNEEVEARYAAWMKATLYRRKLWCMCHAKGQDGEGFGVHRNNDRLGDPVKLDLCLFETEQCATPYLPFGAVGRVDGIHFDEFGNATFYDVLKYHPGGAWANLQRTEPEQIPAAFVLHWFSLRRPGQHRAVPEFRSTLNVGAGSRRWREATVAAAEEAANYAVILHTNLPPEATADLAAPFSTVPSEKRQMVAAPMGWNPTQMEAHHPNASYEQFHRAQVNEQARPKSMPLNIALGDSSQSNFASGKLDRGPYHLQCDVDRADGNDLVLDKSFALWWERAVLVYGWNADPKQPPPHSWDWPRYPIGDAKAEAAATDTDLKNGRVSLSKVYAQDGKDFEDELVGMAKDYGVSVDEMRAILLKTNLAGAAAPAPAAPLRKAATDDGDDADVAARPLGPAS